MFFDLERMVRLDLQAGWNSLVLKAAQQWPLLVQKPSNFSILVTSIQHGGLPDMVVSPHLEIGDIHIQNVTMCINTVLRSVLTY